jgi:hypothetical protein
MYSFRASSRPKFPAIFAIFRKRSRKLSAELEELIKGQIRQYRTAGGIGGPMSFDNDHPSRKDHRKPYRKSKVWDWGCRNHGFCGYCRYQPRGRADCAGLVGCSVRR